MKNKFEIIFALISVLFVVSCGQQPVEKSKYVFISSFRDSGINLNIESSDPNANATKFYAAKAKFEDISEVVKNVLGISKNELVFSDPKSDPEFENQVSSEGAGVIRKVDGRVIVPFSVKGRKPDLVGGQIVTIYFHVIRKDGRVGKLEIDLIEAD